MGSCRWGRWVVCEVLPGERIGYAWERIPPLPSHRYPSPEAVFSIPRQRDGQVKGVPLGKASRAKSPGRGPGAWRQRRRKQAGVKSLRGRGRGGGGEAPRPPTRERSQRTAALLRAWRGKGRGLDGGYFTTKPLDNGGGGEYNKPNSGNRRNAMIRNAKVFFGFCYRSFFMGFGFFGVQAAGSIH